MIVDDSLISEINSLREQASYQLAEQKCREAKSAGGTPAGFGVLHGQILENLNRHEEAIWALREETTAHPEGADAFFHLGRVLIETDRAEIETGKVRGPYMLSFEWGQISCPHHPSFPPSLIAESMACLERCIELDPSRNDARILLALIQFDIPDARAECVPVIQQIVSTSPELHDGHFAMARLALWQGAVEVAHAAFSHVLANAPAYPSANVLAPHTGTLDPRARAAELRSLRRCCVRDGGAGRAPCTQRVGLDGDTTGTDGPELDGRQR